MRTKPKLGNHRGVGEWRNLATAGDVRRYLAWCIHSVRDQSLDAKTGMLMAQMGSFLLKAVEVADLEARMDRIEETVGNDHASSDSKPTWQN